MDDELKAKLAARRSAVENKGEKFENTPTIGSCDMIAGAKEFIPNVARDSIDSASKSKNSLIVKAMSGIIEKKNITGELTIDSNGMSVHWNPMMKIPLPHCLTSSEFGFFGMQKGWQIRLYPRGPKASGDKSTVSLIGPESTAPCRVGIFCGNQMQTPQDWTGELTLDFDPRHVNTSELKITVQAQLKK